LYIIFRKGPDHVRSDTEAFAPSSGRDPILSDIIPDFRPLIPERVRPDPLRYRSLYILFRNRPDTIRPVTGAYTLSSGVEPILSDPIPEFAHYLPEWIRSYPIRCRSLYILSRNGSDPIRSDTRAYTPSSRMDPTRSDPIPERIHLLPKWTRPYPTRYRSLYIIFRCGSDPIRSEAGAYTPSTGMYPILTDPMPELIHPLSEWIRSYPIRHQSLYPFFRNGSDPNRSHTEAYTSSSETGPTLSDPIPELIHYLPVRIRSYTSEAGAYTSSTRLYPIPSDPIPKLIHRIRVALSQIKSQRRSVRLRCDSIDLLHDFYITPNGPL
jgi:hypothetical protein